MEEFPLEIFQRQVLEFYYDKLREEEPLIEIQDIWVYSDSLIPVTTIPQK